MNPTLWLLLLVIGSALLIGGVLAAVLGWLPLLPAIVVAALGGALETAAVLGFVRARRASR
jgi:Flp pilus assembly protein TadB